MKKFPLFIVLVLFAIPPVYAFDKPEHEVMDRLLAGEIVAVETQIEESGGAARMQLLMHTPARSIWEVILSCDKALVFMDGLQFCEVIEDTGGTALVRQIVDQGWLFPTQDFVFKSLRDHYRKIEFRLVEGNLKKLQGFWHFNEIAEGTLVDYEILVQPAMPVPRFLVRRQIHNGTPDLLACIRALAGGSGSVEQSAIDSARCPGE
jgi:ribosome-associated toxin RatA of RatAB toxin-antitoxin module